MAKLEPSAELTESVCNRIRSGNHIEVAAAASGIPRRTLTKWLELGRAEGAEGVLRDFAQRVSDEESACEATVVEGLYMALQNWPQGAMQFLAQRWPDRWGKGAEVAAVKRAENEGKTVPTAEVAESVVAELLARRGWKVTPPDVVAGEVENGSK